MRKIRVSTALIASGAMAAAAIVAASPASAIVGWEPGYSPTCGTGEAGYVDYQAPVIVGRTWKSYVVNGPVKSTAPKTIGTITVRDVCSGVKDVRLSYTNPPGFGFGPVSTTYTTAVTSNWHQTTVPMRVRVGWSSYGPLRVTQTRVRDRFTAFDLNAARTSVLWTYTGSLRSRVSTTTRTILVLAETRNVLSTSTPAVVLGDSAQLSGQLRNAYCEVDCGMVDTPGRTVKLQWKETGTSAWLTVGSTVTDSMGRYTFSDTPTTGGSYRVLFGGRFASPWLAPSVSNSVSVMLFA